MRVNLVIPAKGESERIRGKNMLRFGGKSLVFRACEKSLRCKNVTHVYLDTDCDDIIHDVKTLVGQGLKIIRRPKELASNDLTANDLMLWALHATEDCEVLCETFATSPLITPETMDACIEKFVDSTGGYDSFFTSVPVQEYFWENGIPANFDPKALPNSNNLPKLKMETHGLYGIRTETLLKCKTRVGLTPMLIDIPTNEALDINVTDDLKILEKMLA